MHSVTNILDDKLKPIMEDDSLPPESHQHLRILACLHLWTPCNQPAHQLKTSANSIFAWCGDHRMIWPSNDDVRAVTLMTISSHYSSASLHWLNQWAHPCNTPVFSARLEFSKLIHLLFRKGDTNILRILSCHLISITFGLWAITPPKEIVPAHYFFCAFIFLHEFRYNPAATPILSA